MNDVQICSSALLMVGADEIESFTEQSREAKLCSAIYQTIKDDILASHNWRFSVRQIKLSKSNKKPLFGFSNAFTLPSDFLRLVGKDNPAEKHQIFGDLLHCNLEEVMINYQYAPDSNDYPSYFIRLLEMELAKILSVSLLEDENKAIIFSDLVKTQMLKAKNIDSQNYSNKAIGDSKFNLFAVRY